VPVLNDGGGDHTIEVIWVICSAILGFVVGFWVYFGAIFWKASLRCAIFQVTDELRDKMMRQCYF
jgi:type IV secretory pathway TrbD component